MSTLQTGDPGNEADTNAVSLKLLTFWVSQPHVWFEQTEAQFEIRNITSDRTKYYYIVAALDQETATRLLDVIQNPPETKLYENLKDQIIGIYGLNRKERASKLLDINGLGDRKPSQLLAEMRALAGGHTSCLLFEEIFLRQLPEDVRIQLSNISFSDLKEVGIRDDAAWQAKSGNLGVSAVRRENKQTSSSANTEQDSNNRYSNHLSNWCFYHTKFGARATKCRAPCSYGVKKYNGGKISTLESKRTGHSLLYLWDKNSERKFLVDSGAEISVIQATFKERKGSERGLPLTAANHTEIKTY